MTQTRRLIEDHLPKVIAAIVNSYILPINRWSSMEVGIVGHGELCWGAKYFESAFDGVCQSGYFELAESMLPLVDPNYMHGFVAACGRGHYKIVELMISYGLTIYNAGLWAACGGGHRKIVDLLIAHGADEWNRGLELACENGHHDLVGLMLSHGATKCNWCRNLNHPCLPLFPS